MHYYVHAQHFVLKDQKQEGGYLEIQDGRFQGYQEERPQEGTILDFAYSWVAAGLVDTHIHGYRDHDVMDADPEGLREISRGIVENGVCSYLPTTLTASVDQLNKVCAMIGEAEDPEDGAKIQGAFLEGPFFTEKHKGAQNSDYFMDPSVEVFHHWNELAKGRIRKIAIAPERRGAEEFIRTLTAEGVHVALGHGDADYDTARACVEAGADIFVHCYNGMSGLHHRNPGMVGCCLTSPETVAELICDGHHVHPKAVDIVVKSKGPNHCALITDGMRAGGMPDGHYHLGELPVIVSEGTARLEEGGNLAGSILRLKDGVKNVVKWDVADVEQALRMASEVPARSVGIDDVCGSIAPGRAADFIVLSPELELEKTFLNGKEVYSAR